MCETGQSQCPHVDERLLPATSALTNPKVSSFVQLGSQTWNQATDFSSQQLSFLCHLFKEKGTTQRFAMQGFSFLFLFFFTPSLPLEMGISEEKETKA